MSINRLLSLTSLVLATLLAGCQSNSTQTLAPAAEVMAPATDIKPDWGAIVAGFIDGYFEHYPTFAANAGKHAFDGRLPDFSATGLAATGRWLHAQRDAISSFTDDDLDARQRFQRDYVLAVIDGQLFTLEESGFAYTNPAFYAGDLSPSMYLTRPYAPLAQRMAAFVAYEEALPAAVAQIRANMKTPLPAPYVELGMGMFAGYANFFANDVAAVFAAVNDADLQARFRRANDAAIRATREMADWYSGQKAASTQNFALGAEKFRHMLHASERVDIPLDQLKAIGEADLSRNLRSMRSACHDYAPGKTLEQCVQQAGADKPAGGAVNGAREQLTRLRQFILDKDLATIPGPEEARVEEAPPFNRSNFAYIEIPGPYENGLPSVYYIAPPDPAWPKAEQEAYVPGRASLLFTSVHEVWPGHFLQFLHANRSDWIFGRLFVGYAYAEGWAHYTEEMMFDAGLDGGTAETHIGQLGNALLRDVRFLVAIGLHTEGMSVQEAEAMFRDQAFQDPGNARQQAARGSYDPGYLSYTMGKLMIMQLREDWLATHAGPSALKTFHDTFLGYGGPPIPLVRAQMLGEPAAAKFWRAPALGPPAN